MLSKITYKYSPNFNNYKRNKSDIKFLIIHYTGMRKEKDAIARLINIQSEVSSHYFIKYDGKIIQLIPDLYTAWHAGKSAWRNKKLLNNFSIGIEISNTGHNYGYQNYKKKQITALIKLLQNSNMSDIGLKNKNYIEKKLDKNKLISQLSQKINN